MITTKRQKRMWTAAGAAALLMLSTPAAARPAADPPETPQPTIANRIAPPRECPARIDAIAATLRSHGFTGQAAKNFALFTRQDCMASRN